MDNATADEQLDKIFLDDLLGQLESTELAVMRLHLDGPDKADSTLDPARSDGPTYARIVHKLARLGKLTKPCVVCDQSKQASEYGWNCWSEGTCLACEKPMTRYKRNAMAAQERAVREGEVWTCGDCCQPLSPLAFPATNKQTCQTCLRVRVKSGEHRPRVRVVPEHGTRGRYGYHGCRCLECRLAYNASRRTKRVKGDDAKQPPR